MSPDGEQAPENDQPEITLAVVRRIMELGEILTSALTPDELRELEEAYEYQRHTRQ